MGRAMMKQWWLEHKLPDGNIWKGWINTYANDTVDFPLTLEGKYWVEKVTKGWRGYFWLATQTEAEAMQCQQFVITGGIWRPEKDFSGFNMQDYNTVKLIMDYNVNIADEYTVLERFYGNLEKDVKQDRTGIVYI